MSDDLRPARLVLPGRILKQELDARDWTQRDLAAILGRPEQAISEIVNGTKQITPETSLELSQAFGTSPEFWHNLEANYRLELSAYSGARRCDCAAQPALCRAAVARDGESWLAHTARIGG